MDPAVPAPQEALAITGSRIAAVGDEEGIWTWRGPNTELINLGGRAVIPGLVDAHVHFASYARMLQRIDASEATSLAELVALVAERAAETEPHQWLLGGGWNHNLWEIDRFPRKEDIDAAAGEHPTSLRSKDGHVALVNSVALRLAGVDADTPDPAGGEIERDPRTGEPTGILKERATRLVDKLIPETPQETLQTWIKNAFLKAQAVGLTGVHDHEGPEALIAFQQLAQADEMGLRVLASIPNDGLEPAQALGLCSGIGDHWLRIGGLKLFADGALGARTADMLEPYEDQPNNRGITVMDSEALTERVIEATEANLYVCIHAIGDRANRRALDAIEAAIDATGCHLRHRIEHVQLLHPADIPRFAKLDVIASMQPVHATSDMAMADRYWGERARLAYAWRSLLEADAKLAFGSDAPVEALDPWQGLYAAVTRQRPGGTPKGGWYPGQKLSLMEAMRAFTLDAAYAAGEEEIKGSLTPNKLADLVILSHDVFTMAPEALLTSPVDMTILDGKIVYERK
jgi:hypothetical protein